MRRGVTAVMTAWTANVIVLSYRRSLQSALDAAHQAA
jgi:hypothetical protein